VEHELIRREGSALRVDVLKAGHHGSRTATSAELLETARPSLVVISAGRRNRFGHPAPEVIRRLHDHGVEIARTDLQGTVSLRVAAADGYRWTRISP